MMRYVIIFFLIIQIRSLTAQRSQTNVDVSVSPTYEKITVTVDPEKEVTNEYKINITNCEGKIIKSLSLEEKQLLKGSNVYIHDISLGKYCYSVLNGSKEIKQGEFTVDIYDTW
jgi:hypothetical protein